MCMGSCEIVDIIIPAASRCAKFVNVARDMCCNFESQTDDFSLPTETVASSPTTIDTSTYGKQRITFLTLVDKLGIL